MIKRKSSGGNYRDICRRSSYHLNGNSWTRWWKERKKGQNTFTQSWPAHGRAAGLSKSATITSLSNNLKEWDPGQVDRFLCPSVPKRLLGRRVWRESRLTFHKTNSADREASSRRFHLKEEKRTGLKRRTCLCFPVMIDFVGSKLQLQDQLSCNSCMHRLNHSKDGSFNPSGLEAVG
jgi:hypothetical protein